jgi:hypothetical protein
MNEIDNVDTAVVRRLLRDNTDKSRELKRLLRAPWTRPMAAEQRALCALRRKTTMLCVVRALSRGRYHLRKPPRDLTGDWNQARYHRGVADRAIERYGLTKGER